MVRQRGLRCRRRFERPEALFAVQQKQYDLALLDIKMPGMDGMELQKLREVDPDLTVIIMTGYASVETAVQALKHGAPTTTSPNRSIPTSWCTWCRTRWGTSREAGSRCACARTFRRSIRTPS